MPRKQQEIISQEVGEFKLTKDKEDLLELLKGLRADVNNPYKAHKAGDMIILLKKINRKIDNYDRIKRNRRNCNKRI